jgi:hypothetical protein
MGHKRVRAVIAAALAGGVLASAPAAAEPGTVLSGSGYFEIIDRADDGTVWAWRNNGGFDGGPNIYPGSPRQIGAGWGDYTRLLFGDINGDTYDDMVSMDTNGNVRAFANVGGNFPGTGVVIGTGWTDLPQKTKFADIDGDGRDEIIFVRDDGEVWAWRNVNGLSPNAYSAGYQVIGVGWYEERNVFFADINGDGKDEIVDLHGDDTVRAWRNVNGLGGGLNPPTYSAGWQTIGVGWRSDEAWRLKFADLNNDQRAEIIAIELGGDVRAFRNVNGLNPNTYSEPAKVIGVGWFSPWQAFFAEIDP